MVTDLSWNTKALYLPFTNHFDGSNYSSIFKFSSIINQNKKIYNAII